MLCINPTTSPGNIHVQMCNMLLEHAWLQLPIIYYKQIYLLYSTDLVAGWIVSLANQTRIHSHLLLLCVGYFVHPAMMRYCMHWHSVQEELPHSAWQAIHNSHNSLYNHTTVKHVIVNIISWCHRGSFLSQFMNGSQSNEQNTQQEEYKLGTIRPRRPSSFRLTKAFEV